MKNCLLLLLTLSLFWTACRKKEEGILMNAQKDQEILSAYFSAATVGVISAADPLRYMLLEPLESLPAQSEMNEIIQLDPKADGVLTISNNSVLTFTPNGPLLPDKTYKITINLQKLNPTKYKTPITYEVRTFRQEMKVEREGFLINDDGSSSMLVSVKTADKVDAELLKKSFISDADQTEILEVSENTHQLDFRYDKGMKATSFIRYDGKLLHTDSKGDVQLFDVDTKQFGVVYTHHQSDNKTFNIYFTQKLNRQADLTGLVRVQGNNALYTINNNLLSIQLSDQRFNNKISITLDKNIKSESGNALAAAYTFELDVSVDEPAISFVSDGHYFPSEGDFKIPIKARALESVRMYVIEIKQENVQHFLAWQSLIYAEFYNLRMYGKPIYDKEVKLVNGVADNEGWTMYGIDLSDQIKKNPGSIYHISMDFGPQNTTLSCKADLKKYGFRDAMPDKTYFNTKDYLYNEYDTHYNHFVWEEVSNPCKISYYLDQRLAQKLFICSDYSIIAKKAGNDYHIALNKLLDLSTVGDAEITLYDQQAEKLSSTNTNSEGFAVLTNTAYDAAVLKVNKGNQTTYLPLDPAESNSLTEFDISGERSEADTEFFIYTDRDVWRPGDSIYVDLMINKKYSNLPQGLPVVLSFYNTENLLIDEQIQNINIDKKLIHSFTLQTPSSAKTGVYRCMIKVGSTNLRKNIRIETIKPNTGETIFKFDKIADNTIYSENISGSLRFQYLTGFEIKGAKIKTIGRARKLYTPFPEFKEYYFDIYQTTPSTSFDLLEVVTNNDGSANFKSSESFKYLNGLATISLETESILPGGGTNKEGKSVKISPFQSYIGAFRKPGSGWSGNHTFTENIDIELINLNEKGKLSTVSNTINYTLQKNIKYWWVDKYRLTASGNFVSDDHWEDIRTENKSITGKTKITFPKGNLEKGAYRLILTDEKSEHQTEVYFSVYDGKESIPGTEPYILEFEAEKDEYKVGEDVKLRLPDIAGAKVLISIERGNKVLEQKWFDLAKDKNLITLKTDESWSPNVYIHLTLIQPYKKVSNDLPLRMYGIRHLKMDGSVTQLKPVATLPEKLESNKSYTFNVSEAEGRPMEYTIAVVDEGLLNLTGFGTPDPHKHFNGKYPLLVKTWDLYKYLINYFKGTFAGIISIGGDDAYNPDAIAEVSRFKPVAIHMGPFKAEKGQKKSHTLTIPNYIGKVRVMIVACNPDNFGKSEQFLPVKNPLMVQSQFPRTLNVSDKLQLPVTILRDEASISTAVLQVKADNTYVKGFTPSTSLTFSGKDQLLKVFDIEVLNKTGQLDVEMSIESGGKAMKENTSILIQYPNSYASDVNNYFIEPGEKLELTVNSKGYKEVFTSKMMISGLMVPNFTQYAEELIEYPYGCLEQSTSIGFAQLYLDKILNLDPQENRKRLENLQTSLNKITRLQKSDGKFSYWDNTYYHAWSDIYAGNFLVEMQRLNYLSGNSDMLRKWLNAHTDIANKWALAEVTDRYFYESESLAQAFRLHVLAKASKPAKSAMNRFVSGNNAKHPLVWWLMAGTFKVSGYDSKAKEMMQKAEKLQINHDGSYHYDSFGEKGRDWAMIVEVLSLFEDEKVKLDQYYNQMVETLNSASWSSTHTKAYAFIAAYRYFGKSLQLADKADYNLSGLTGGTKNHQHSAYEAKLVRIAPADYGKKILIENKGKGKLYIYQTNRFIDNNLYKDAEKSNLGLNVSYFNATQNKASNESVRLGDDLIITATVNNPSALVMENLALNVKMPAGWELINPRLYETTDNTQNVKYNYQDFRDDRVYTFFDLPAGKASEFKFRAKAGFSGDFYMPAISCEHMYKGNIYARTSGQRTKVAK